MALYLVLAKLNFLQRLHILEERGHSSTQLVVTQVEFSKIWKTRGNKIRKGAAEAPSIQVEFPQLGELAQLAWNGSVNLQIAQMYVGHPAVDGPIPILSG